MKNGITYKDLFFSFGEIISILDLKINHYPNRHAELSVTVLLDAEMGDSLFYEMPQTVALKYLAEEGEQILFRGALTAHSMYREGEHRILTMKILDSTYWMDISRETRCFQNLTMTSHQVIDQILSEYPSSDCLKNIPNEPIGELIYQYEETDWEFLCRFLSKYSDSIYPGAIGDGIQIKAGLSLQAEDVEWDNNPFLMKMNLDRYRLLKKNGKEDLLQTDFISYIVTGYDVLPIGSQVTYRAVPWFISYLERTLEGGILVSRYELAQKKGLAMMRKYNERIAGISVDGKVDAVSRDKIQVTLAEDRLQCKEGKYWFPYSTVAASADGSGWYCMPEKGESIRIFFPTCVEADAYGVTNMKGESKGTPDVRSIRSPYGSQVKYKKDGILIETGSHGGYIKLGKDGITTIKSEKGIALSAGTEIRFEAPEIEVNSETEVNLKNDGGSDILMTPDDVTLHGQEIYEN